MKRLREELAHERERRREELEAKDKEIAALKAMLAAEGTKARRDGVPAPMTLSRREFE